MTNEQKASRLLPCPFCGGRPNMRSWDYPYVRYQARCNCGVTAGPSRYKSEAVAAERWNTRAQPQAMGVDDA